MQDKIIELLGRGYAQTIVASAVGCDESYISQLVSQPEVRDQISALRLTHVHASVALDDGVDDLEARALDKMHQMLPFITKPMEAIRIYQIANAAKRRSSEVSSAVESKAPIVQFVLPSVMAVQFKLSSDKQVVEINGKSMSALPSARLNKQLEERRNSTATITDSTTAAGMLNTLERGIPKRSVVHLL